MGQYWYPVNLDKKERIHAHKLGCGLKLWEQLASHPGTGAALIILCASHPEVRGGGDLGQHDGVMGRWAGDRIVLIGDYAEGGDLDGDVDLDLGNYKDITDEVCLVIEQELGGKFTGQGWRDFSYNS